MQQVGVSPARTWNQFVEQLDRKHGRQLAKHLVDLMTGQLQLETNANSLYDVKNATLALSLDFATYSADLYRRFFDWVLSRRLDQVDSILDIGCDNGLATCFFATCFPAARVVGIDISETAVARARELGDRLRLTNVSFEVQDFQTFKESRQEKPFDLIISLRSITELIADLNNVHYWSIENLHQRLETARGLRPSDGTETIEYVSSTRSAIAVAERVASLLGPTGTFLSLERLTHAGALHAWIYALSQAKLQVDFAHSTWLSFHEVGIEQQFPLLSVKKGASETNDPVACTYKLLQLVSPNHVEMGRTLHDDRAVLAFRHSTDKIFVEGVHAVYPDGAGEERKEIWKDGRSILEYHLTDRGFRELTRYAEERLAGQRDALHDWMQLKTEQNCQCTLYIEPFEHGTNGLS